MTSAEFRYSETRSRYYPVIFLHLKRNNIELDTYALIDSGASMSTFHADVANSLGIEIENGEKRTSSGICGKVDVYIHNLELKVFEIWFPCKIAFSKQLTSSFNLLGREGFFDKHLVTFNEKERKTILTEFQ